MTELCHLLQITKKRAYLLQLRQKAFFEICSLQQWLSQVKWKVIPKHHHIPARNTVVIEFAALLVICCKNAAFCSKIFILQLSTHPSVIQHPKIPLYTTFHALLQICNVYLTQLHTTRFDDGAGLSVSRKPSKTRQTQTTAGQQGDRGERHRGK